MFLYIRTKGEIEEALIGLKLAKLSIYRPGLLLNRDNDARFIEKLGSIVPFIDKIEATDLAKALRAEAELQHSSERTYKGEIIPEVYRYTNDQIKSLISGKA